MKYLPLVFCLAVSALAGDSGKPLDSWVVAQTPHKTCVVQQNRPDILYRRVLATFPSRTAATEAHATFVKSGRCLAFPDFPRRTPR